MNSRVDARALANVDGRTYGRTNGRKTGSLYREIPEAGATKMGKKYVETQNFDC